MALKNFIEMTDQEMAERAHYEAIFRRVRLIIQSAEYQLFFLTFIPL